MVKLKYLKFIHLLCVLAFIFSYCRITVEAALDLEEMAQEFVLETKKIDIPGYPDAFNPSIIRWNGSLLMCFRNIPNPRFSFTSHLGLVWLDEEFNPIGDPQILETQPKTSLIPSRAEDGRLLAIDDHLWLVFSDNKNAFIFKGGFRLFIAELELNGNQFIVKDLECLYQFEGEDINRREKNWTPFASNGKMHLIYSVLPHLIFSPLHGTQSCETVATSLGDIKWDWGILRGGTTGLIVDNQYLTFFHSQINMPSVHSNDKNCAHYFMGAYTFSLEQPFEITKFSPEPIIGKHFYHGKQYKPYWGSVNVVFPGGFIFDDTNIWIAYGRQDHECWIVKLDKQGLLNSLVPVTTLSDNI